MRKSGCCRRWPQIRRLGEGRSRREARPGTNDRAHAGVGPDFRGPDRHMDRREGDLLCVRKREFVVTTDFNHKGKIDPNWRRISSPSGCARISCSWQRSWMPSRAVSFGRGSFLTPIAVPRTPTTTSRICSGRTASKSAYRARRIRGTTRLANRS